jgi:hypothetical protein
MVKPGASVMPFVDVSEVYDGRERGTTAARQRPAAALLTCAKCAATSAHYCALLRITGQLRPTTLAADDAPWNVLPGIDNDSTLRTPVCEGTLARAMQSPCLISIQAFSDQVWRRAQG